MVCLVRGCIEEATESIEDFAVCSLHDSEETREILEKLECPARYFFKDRWIVLPCGPLEESHFEPKKIFKKRADKARRPQ